MRRYKNIICLLLIITCAVSQVSCWDQREVERLGIVLATGIDLAPNGGIRLVVQNINPAAMGGGGGGGGGGGPIRADKSYRNRSIEGSTIFEAIRELSRETPRQLFFAHNQVILVSERLARERGVTEVMDFFERNPQIRRTTWLLLGEGDLDTLLDVPGRLEDTPAQRIVNIINERRLTSQYGVLRLGEFLEMLESENTHPYTAVLEVIRNPAVPERQRSGIEEGFIREPKDTYLFSKTAVFRRDKLVGFLDTRESRGLLWIKGEVEGGIIVIPIPGKEREKISLEIIRSKTDLKPEIRDGRVYMTVDIKEESNLNETTGTLDLTKPETLKELEDLQNRAIRNEVEAALRKAQEEYGVDIFGFGETIHRKLPGEWKTMKNMWQDIYPNVQVTVRVKSEIRRTGMVTKPIEIKQ